jgi:hypothetical protein
MSEIPTPLTDQFEQDLPAVYDHSDACENWNSAINFARALERDLTAARERLAECEKERDRWISGWDSLVEESADYCEKWSLAKSERDAALAELAKLKETQPWREVVEALDYAGIGKEYPFNKLESVITAERSKYSGDNWDYWNYVLEKLRALRTRAEALLKGTR